MNFLTFVFLVGFAALAKASADGKPQYDLKDAERLFEKFQKDYNKHYSNEEDKQIRFNNFKKTLEIINKLNKEQPSATYDINSFADEDEKEFIKKHTGLKVPHSN